MDESKKYSLLLKGVTILGLTLALLIPTHFINNLISEREHRQTEAFQEINAKWADAQTLCGPVINIPYLESLRDSTGQTQTFRRYIHILPENLKISGKLNPEKRYRGIYEVVVYNAKLNFTGDFTDFNLQNMAVRKENILYDEAFVSLGISDLKGIKEKVQVNLNGDNLYFNAGVETNDLMSSGIHAPIKLDLRDSLKSKCTFSFDLNLNGSRNLYFTPIGKETSVEIAGNWSDPNFSGAYLPDKRSISAQGFNAQWKQLHLNRDYPQIWKNAEHDTKSSTFGINLIVPVDYYVKSDRAIKYAVLVIGLTFFLFYLLELLNRRSVHPLQYLLIGFALCIFYILLISISEHLNFNISYCIASVMTIGLIAWYSMDVLKDKRLGALIAVNLGLLYGFIFCLIQIQDYALLMGSLGLFVILAVVMYFSKRINLETDMAIE